MQIESKLRNSDLSLFSFRNGLLAGSIVIYTFLWIGGVGQQVFSNPERRNPDWLASAFLLLAGIIVLLGTGKTRQQWILLSVAAFGLVVEIVGVRFGLPFGDYSYSGVLQPQIFRVPIVMAFAWMVLVSGVKETLRMVGLRRWLEVLLAALWMTAIDLVIDPLAANALGYWSWRTAGYYYGIPAGNFLGWFVTSLVVFVLIDKRWPRNSWSFWIALSIVMFFTLIAFSQRLYAVAIIGVVLIGLQLLLVKMYQTSEFNIRRKER